MAEKDFLVDFSLEPKKDGNITEVILESLSGELTKINIFGEVSKTKGTFQYYAQTENDHLNVGETFSFRGKSWRIDQWRANRVIVKVGDQKVEELIQISYEATEV